MDIWTPTSRESTARIEQQKALVNEMLTDLHRMNEWNRELKQIDENLELVKAHDAAKAPGLKPGYYHVLRHVPGGSPFLKAIEHPDGSFREPDAGVFRELKDWDCWDDRVLRDREKRARKIEEAEERYKANKRREQAEEILDRYKAANNPGVSFTNRGKGWSYRAGKK